MSDTSFTILEVHLGDGDIQLGPFGLDVAPDEQAEVAGATETPDGDVGAAGSDGEDAGEDAGETNGKYGCCSAKSIVGVVLAVGLLAAAAVAAAKLLGDDEESSSSVVVDA